MSNKATAKVKFSGPSTTDDLSAAKSRSSNPLDGWLKREIESLYVDMESEPLPASLAELAAELEGKLKSTTSRNKKTGPN
jgi:hypothetical protein